MEQQQDKISQYCAVMEEIKRRDLVVRGFLSGKCRTIYKATNLESTCLQIRKILELISLASLVANKEEFSKFHEKYHQYWHGGRILDDIEKINPDFYPKPLEEKKSSIPGIVNELIDVKTGHLTKEDFIEVYNKCGKILHADNPFGSKTDYSWYDKQISVWLSKIIRLLNNHKIKLKDDPNMYVIHMKENKDDKVHGYTFGKMETMPDKTSGS